MGKLDFLGGINSLRLRRLLQEAINHLELDLNGAQVLTEAASGIYAATPILAAAAGAKVQALTRDSAYASVPEVSTHVMSIAKAVGVSMDNIQISTNRASVPSRLDIITNLGFVRPVDTALLELVAPGGVVSYMCEAWELRDGDVDLAACDRLNVPVAGVWEDFDGLNIFRSCGQLAVKLCFEAGLEVAANRIILLSGDKFGPVIAEALRANLAVVTTLSSVTQLREELVADTDAIFVADYADEGTILGGDGGPSIAELAKWNQALLVIQFAGSNNVFGLSQTGISVFPERQLEPRRMAFTLAHLGLRPTIFLHAAGLKVGELLWRARTTGSIPPRFRTLVQPMNEPARACVGKAI